MGAASLAARLAQEISAGRWSEGEALPGVRALAREVGCSPGTAARAYTALREDAEGRDRAALLEKVELVDDTRARLALNVSEELALEALAYRLER